MSEANAPKAPRPVFRVRIGLSERLIIAAAAAKRCEPVSTYVRRTTLAVAREEIATA